MNSKFIVAIVVVALALGVLMYSATSSTAKAVVTVGELVEHGAVRERVRLGARVAVGEIKFQARPTQEVRFSVRDISGPETTVVPVVYHGTMPDTLKNGRDVILEGNYDGKEFVAESLMTQCPSKYEPPKPGETKGNAGKAYD